MDDRCCGLCRHNPYWTLAKPGWFTRLLWWPAWMVNRLFGRLVFVRNEPELPPTACSANPRLFCYDVRGSQACQYAARTSRPEFLACKTCPAFELQHKVPGVEGGQDESH